MQLNHFGDTVRFAVLGLGSRGISQMRTLLEMPDVNVTAVCDVYADRTEEGAQMVEAARGKRPFASTDADACMDRPDVDAVIIMTSWETHVPLCLKALKYGKRPALEVGGAASVDECWRMVRASEETGIPVMLLENCCYGDKELTLLNMIRQGIFGTVVHCAGSYAHDLRDEIGLGDINRHYRQRHFLHRNGELYPTHELGPIANYLNINRGNRMTMLTSMASKACGLHEWLGTHRTDTALSQAQVNEGETAFFMSQDGRDVTVYTDGRALSPEEKTMLVLWLCHKKTGKLFDLAGVPRAAEMISSLEKPGGEEACCFQEALMTDGLAALLEIAQALKHGSVRDFIAQVPETHIRQTFVPCASKDKGRVLRSLCGQVTLPYTLEEGMRVAHQGGYASIVPDNARGCVRVTGESADSEFARELCDFYGRKIQNIAKAKKQNTILP